MKRSLLLVPAVMIISACSGGPMAGDQPTGSAVLGGAQPKVVQQGSDSDHFLVFPEPGGRTDLYPFQVTRGPDGKIWFTVQQYDGGGQVGFIDNAGAITQFPIPVRAYPWDITTGPDGLLWFVDTRNSVVGSVTTTGVITTYTAQAYGSITSGPHGSVWFAGGPGIGKITQSGKFTYYTLPYKVLALAAGKDGNLWFTNGQITEDHEAIGQTLGPVIVGSMTPSGSYTVYTIPNATGSGVGIAAGHDGNMWVLVQNGSAPGMIVRVEPNGNMTEFTLPGDILGVDNNRIISAPSGELWYTRNSSSPTQYIGRISLTGQISEHLYPTPDRFVSFLGGLAIGNDGNIWFSQTNPVQDGMGVYLRHEMVVTPSSIEFHGIGESKDVTVREDRHLGSWSASTSNSGVATVTQGSSQDVFTITAIGSGTAIVTISDSKDNDFEVPVTVP